MEQRAKRSRRSATSIWGSEGLKGWMRERAAVVQSAEDREDRVVCGQRALVELLERLPPTLSVSTRVQYVKSLRTHIREACPGIEKKDLPSADASMYKQCNQMLLENAAKRFENPPKLNGDLLIQKITMALRHGIDFIQAPQVLFCLGYLVGLRSSDLNTAHVRRTGERTFRVDLRNDFDIAESVVEDDGRRSRSVGTLLNLRPSKAKQDTCTAYATPFICDSDMYPLVWEALAFLRDPATQNLPCNRFLRNYPKTPSGPTSCQEWDKTLFPHMIKSFGFYDAVAPDDRSRVKFTANLGRSFVASCVEQGRFCLGENLQPSRAVELILGHRLFSTSNGNYLRLDVRPSVVPGVVLKDLKFTRHCFGGHGGKQGVSYGAALVPDGVKCFGGVDAECSASPALPLQNHD